MATSNIAVTEGSGKNLATNSITEDSITKQIQRAVLNNSSGTEIGTALNPLQVALAVSTPGDDETNNVKMVEQQMAGLMVTSDTQIKGTSGFVHTITFSPNDAAPTAGSIIVYDSLSETGTQIFNVTFTTSWFAPFTVTLNMRCNTGIYVGFTTTADVNCTISYR